MAIARLKIQGFRSLKDLDWHPGSLNIVIGPNGSGKSNLLRSLMMLRAAATGTLEDFVLRSGGMGAITWDSSATEISWEVTLDDSSGVFEHGLAMNRVGMSADYHITKEHMSGRGGAASRRGGVFVNGRERDIGKRFNLAQNSALFALRNDEPFGEIADRLESMSVYHDIDVHQHAEIRRAAVTRRDTALSPDGQNVVSVLHTLYSTDREFKRTLNESMRAAFGTEFEELTFPPAADQRVDLRLRWRSLRTEQSAADLSDGTLRFLLLVTMLASPAPAEVIAIDEPELGLHPNMFPIITELAREASQRTQIIMTTHSPQFLDAFAEPPTTTVATVESGETKLATLSGTDLAAWLERYTLGELFRSGELEAMA